jgi:hypothetical protein
LISSGLAVDDRKRNATEKARKIQQNTLSLFTCVFSLFPILRKEAGDYSRNQEEDFSYAGALE